METPFIKAYNSLSEAKKLKADPSQHALVVILNEFWQQIKATHSFNFWTKFYPKFIKNKYQGLYIWGGVGRGKSMLLNIFFDSLPIKNKLRIHFHEFMLQTHKKLEQLNHNIKIRDHLKHYAQTTAKMYSVLVLDELQINNIVDAMIVGRLFKLLIENKCLVFFTSNNSPKELFKDGLQRELFLPFIDFINQHLQVFNLDNQIDYRINNLNINNFYLYPLNQQNKKIICDIKQNMLESHQFEQQSIEVDKNKQLLVLAYGQIALFTFDQLCNSNFGAIDYLALCKHFKVIILENIPQLSSSEHNQLLRFITLIDCIYENKIKLICTADAKIEEIYQDGKHLLEFQRTISRLNELKSGLRIP